MEWKCVCVCDPFRGITRKVMIFVCRIFCSFFVKAAPHTTTVSMELISFFIGLLSEKSRPAFISFHSQTKNVFVCSAQLLKHTNTHMMLPLFLLFSAFMCQNSFFWQSSIFAVHSHDLFSSNRLKPKTEFLVMLSL
jgi:hypothetical protein